MQYPILPVIFPWETAHAMNLRVNQSRIQDGVTERRRQGINNTTESIDVRVKTVYWKAVDDFLKARRGQPFRIHYENQLTQTDSLYRCADWALQPIGEGLWEFQGQLEQVRRWRREWVNLAEGQIVSAFKTIANTTGPNVTSLIASVDDIIYPSGTLPVHFFGKAYSQGLLQLSEHSYCSVGSQPQSFAPSANSPAQPTLHIAAKGTRTTNDSKIYIIAAPLNILHYAWRGTDAADNGSLQWDVLFFPDGAIEVRFGDVSLTDPGFCALTDGASIAIDLLPFLLPQTSFVIPATTPVTAAFPGSYQYPKEKPRC